MKNFQRYDRASAVILSVTLFLGILAFVPGGLIPESVLKGYCLLIGVLAAFVAWLIGRLVEGSFRIPWTPMLGATGIFILSVFLSALFSHAPYLAFFGEGFEQGTFAVLASLSLSLFLCAVLFTTPRRVVGFLKAFFIVYGLLAIYQLAHLFIPAQTAFGLFVRVTDTPAGAWSDFAFLSGAALIGSVMVLQFLKMKRTTRWIFVIDGILALFFVILANIFVVWMLVGSAAIVILVYSLVANRFMEERRFPLLPFVLSLIALLFILANTLFGGILSNALHASYGEVHPNLSATAHIAEQSIRHNPIFGPGPNHFMSEWLTYRPTTINTNTFWDTPFTAGVSLFGTFALLGGIVGLLAGLAFLAAYGYELARKLFKPSSETTGHGMSGMIFGLAMISLYFLLGIVLFSPGIAISICAFAFIGIFFGALASDGRVAMREFNFLKDPRAGFFSILGVVALVLVSVGTAYAATERFAAVVLYEKGLASIQANDLTTADTRLTRAIALADLPLFERTRTALAGQTVQQILSSVSPSAAPSAAASTNLKNAITIGNAAGRQAVALDPSDPANYLALGDFLRLIVPLKITGVSDAAVGAYQQAIALAPNYPKSYLDLAALYFATGDDTNAEAYIAKALAQKINYTDAYFLAAQIDVSNNDMSDAIQEIQTAANYDPSNPDVYFELGLLHYNDGDYADAKTAFETAINLDAQDVNAWYYLALSDQKTGDAADANSILAELHKAFPANQDVIDAQNGVQAPSTSTPITSAPTTAPSTPATPPAKPAKTKKTTAKTSTTAPSKTATSTP